MIFLLFIDKAWILLRLHLDDCLYLIVADLIRASGGGGDFSRIRAFFVTLRRVLV